VEMSHLPTGITVRMEGRQDETSLPTLQSKARELLGRKVREALNAKLIKEDQSESDIPHAT
jgi:protein subunit release factor A